MPRLAALALVGAALLLEACGGGVTQGGAGGAASTRAATPAATGQPPEVPEVLAFTAPAIGGGDIRAASYAGRPVVLWFWSPW